MMVFSIEALVPCSILFASSINFLIPPVPNAMLCRHRGLCCRRNRQTNIAWGGWMVGKCFQDVRKSNYFTAKCLNTFATPCWSFHITSSHIVQCKVKGHYDSQFLGVFLHVFNKIFRSCCPMQYWYLSNLFLLPLSSPVYHAIWTGAIPEQS